jgi:hypothetical protein
VQAQGLVDVEHERVGDDTDPFAHPSAILALMPTVLSGRAADSSMNIS